MEKKQLIQQIEESLSNIELERLKTLEQKQYETK